MAEPSFVFRRADGTFCELSYGAPAAHSTIRTISYAGHTVPRPRNIDRPYRDSDDEPAKSVYMLCRLRQSLHLGRSDRTRCPACAQPVGARAKGGPSAHSPSPNGSSTDAVHRRTMMSPRRVFRDLLKSDAAEPLRPAVTDALLAAVGHLDWDSSDASPPPWAPPATFSYFSALPFEIRRMIWELALPSRILLQGDLKQQHSHDQPSRLRLVPHGTHSIQELWQSDLFHVCTEARDIVEAYTQRGTGLGTNGWAPRPNTGISSEARLASTLDVLYFPWLGSRAATLSNGNSDSTTQALTAPMQVSFLPSAQKVEYSQWMSQLAALLPVRLPTIALDLGWIDKHHADTLAWIAGVDLKCLVEDGGDGSSKTPSTWTVTSSALRSVQVVVADVLVPVGLRLDQCTPAQRQVLLHSRNEGSINGQLPDLMGKDFTVLVDLYDDWRIDEVLSLARPRQTANHWRCGLEGRVVNKAAGHRCLGCTRAAWEARDWNRFGEHLGARLRQLCRPVVVFSVILEFQELSSIG